MNHLINKADGITAAQAEIVSSTKPWNTYPAQLLSIACLLGALVGVVFIVIQPFFGMDTLTSRHAAAYQQLGNWSSIAAITIAWGAHLAVSVFYGLLSGVVILRTARLEFVALFTLLFTWLTTVIAPPANAMIVQFVSFQQINIDKLPGVNFSLDVKFVLHLLFFAVISAVLYLNKKK
ncbi:hypothetical protein [Psychromonas sp.]|uniref:hypothetical protein n=1 Tax=Psychromonas sp. TaxID=1884585 RepID=UPI00356233A6